LIGLDEDIAVIPKEPDPLVDERKSWGEKIKHKNNEILSEEETDEFLKNIIKSIHE